MNRLQFNLFVRGNFDAKYNQGTREWRFRNGREHMYTLVGHFKCDHTTWEENMVTLDLSERLVQDEKPSGRIPYKSLGKLSSASITAEEAKSWIVKQIIESEFE